MKFNKIKGCCSGLLFLAIGFACFFSGNVVAQTKSMISFMGAPGAGKGTLAGKCIKELRYGSLSVGNILREEIAKGTSLGEKVKCINEGKFASDELVIEVVESWLTENLDKIDTLILDGFPRTARQAGLFLNLLHTKFDNVSFRVVDFVVTDETVVQRIANRLVCEKCQEPESRALFKGSPKLICKTCGGNLIKRADDREEVVRDRLKAYAGHVEPLLDVYHKADIKIDFIDAEQKTPQQVFEEFIELLGIDNTDATPETPVGVNVKK